MSASAEAIEPSLLRELTPLTSEPHPQAFKALTPHGQPVLLKRFSLVTAADWKAYELFEREARALQQLDHPRLPRLLAYGEDSDGIYLISSWIVGISLAEQLELGRRWSEPELLNLARQLLELLVWLHERQPAMIHRDIKPANLIVNTAGELFLIDFGSVLLRVDAGGSTVAGTFGYMAPEQLSGRALPASDLYALGATLIHLLSGTAPAEMPQERLQLRFEPYLSCSDALSRWLRRLLAPIPEDRFASAAQALTALERLGVSQTPAVALAELTLQPPPALVAALIQAHPTGLEIILPESPLGAREFTRWGRRRARAGALLLLGAAVSPVLPIWPLFLLGAVGGGIFDGWRLLRLGARVELGLDAYGLEISFWRGQRRLHQLQIVRADVLSAARVSTKMGQMLELVYLDGFGTRRSCPLAIDADPALAEWLTRQLEIWRSGPEASRPVLGE